MAGPWSRIYQRSHHALHVAGSAFLVVTLLVLAMVLSDAFSGENRRSDRDRALPVKPAGLIESTTFTEIRKAPRDPHPHQRTRGMVVHPQNYTKLYRTPGGTAIGVIGPRQIGPTWLPVIDERRGWVRVLLPSRPNRSSAWMPSSNLVQSRSPYLISVHLKSLRLELYRDGDVVGSWVIGIGQRATPTPLGRTFVLGVFTDPAQSYSPVILALGSHSDVLKTFSGGPGTVGIHSWPTSDVLGRESSAGCIRVPQQALERLRHIPSGTVVLVDSQ